MVVKQKIRGIVASVLLIFWIISSVSGIILYFAPEGPRSGRVTFFGFQKRDWVQIHSLLSFLTVAIAAIHIILEWQIFIGLIRQLFKGKD